MFDMTITERCHRILSEYVGPGDVAIDATCGNGNDTLFLAEAVGDKGHVFAFDIQMQAIMATQLRVMEAGYENVTCINESNESMEQYVASGASVIMFNLGYLPGGDHSVTTNTENTLSSIKMATSMINVGGVVSIIAYPGHEEGAKEAAAIEEFVKKLPSGLFEVLTITQTNRSETCPVMHLVARIR